MNLSMRFTILLYCVYILLIFCSCHQQKTTETIIANQTDYSFTISFNNGKNKYLIKSKNQKTVSIEEDEYPSLSFPFDNDTIIVKFNSTILYFSKAKINEENNMFNEENWTYETYTNYYTKATYTFTNTILNEMDEIEQ